MTEKSVSNKIKPAKKGQAPAPKEEYDFVKHAKGVNSPGYCRVPGQLPAMGKMKHEAKALKNEFKKKNLHDLKDLLISTRRIALNEQLLRKLPDRGAKVLQKLEVLESLVAEREGCEDLVNALAKLSLPDTDAMEWRTKAAVMNTPEPTTNMDKTLKVLAEGTLSTNTEKQIKDDLQDTSSKEYLSKNEDDTSQLTTQQKDDMYKECSNNYFNHKIQVLDTVKSKVRFVPTDSLHSSDLDKVKLGLSGQRTSPVPVGSQRRTPETKTEAIPLPKYLNSTAKQLSLQESLEIQREQAVKLREVTMRHAAARLAASSSAAKHIAAKTSESLGGATVKHIVDTRWRDTTEKGEPDTSEDEDGGEGREWEQEKEAIADLALDSDDDEA